MKIIDKLRLNKFFEHEKIAFKLWPHMNNKIVMNDLYTNKLIRMKMPPKSLNYELFLEYCIYLNENEGYNIKI